MSESVYPVSGVVVENQAGQSIARLQIMMRSVRIATFKDVPDGAVEESSFRVTGDLLFDLTGSLADGTSVGGEFGSVPTRDYGGRPRFVVRKGGKIDFSQ